MLFRSGDITVRVVSAEDLGDVTLTAQGSIENASTAHFVYGGTAILTAVTGDIGSNTSGSPLDLKVDNLDATAGGSIFVKEFDAVTVDALDAGGEIEMFAGGDIELAGII